MHPARDRHMRVLQEAATWGRAVGAGAVPLAQPTRCCRYDPPTCHVSQFTCLFGRGSHQHDICMRGQGHTLQWATLSHSNLCRSATAGQVVVAAMTHLDT
jgi:hypothetical protein